MPIETPHGTGYMYVMHDKNFNESSVIKSGDWSDR